MNGRHGTFFFAPWTKVLLPRDGLVPGCFVGAVSHMCTRVVCQVVHVYQCHMSSIVCYMFVPGPVTGCQGSL